MIFKLIFLFVLIVVSQSMAFVFKPNWVSEGDGAKVIRIIGNKYLKKMDPFLMLDLFKVRLPAGFPDHPHRGFQTVTYMLSGSFYHQDFKGHKGRIDAGDLQWMTAGKGIVHSQMPASFNQDSYGFQLWINLSKDLKLTQPQYQQYKNKQLQIIQLEKAKVKIISGQWKGKKGPILARTPTYYFDIQLKQDGQFQIPIPEKWNTLIFVYEGNLQYQSSINQKKTVDQFNCLVLSTSDKQQINHKFKASKHSKFVLIGGKPLNQPIVQYGPFVMNTQNQINQAFSDFQSAKNGFQGQYQWHSKIKNLSKGKSFQQL